MNDMIQVYFDYDVDNLQERFGIEKEIQYLDKLVEKYGWKYSGIYNLKEAVVIGDILLVQTCKGQAYAQVQKITNIAGKDAISKHKKVIGNITALNETKKN